MSARAISAASPLDKARSCSRGSVRALRNRRGSSVGDVDLGAADVSFLERCGSIARAQDESVVDLVIGEQFLDVIRFQIVADDPREHDFRAKALSIVATLAEPPSRCSRRSAQERHRRFPG